MISVAAWIVSGWIVMGFIVSLNEDVKVKHLPFILFWGGAFGGAVLGLMVLLVIILSTIYLLSLKRGIPDKILFRKLKD